MQLTQCVRHIIFLAKTTTIGDRPRFRPITIHRALPRTAPASQWGSCHSSPGDPCRPSPDSPPRRRAVRRVASPAPADHLDRASLAFGWAKDRRSRPVSTTTIGDRPRFRPITIHRALPRTAPASQWGSCHSSPGDPCRPSPDSPPNNNRGQTTVSLHHNPPCIAQNCAGVTMGKLPLIARRSLSPVTR